MPSSPVALHAEAHSGLKVSQIQNAEHLKERHIAVIYTAEYILTATESPIVFLKEPDHGDFISVVLWGIEVGENLFVEGQQWVGGYIPASIRCLPFATAINPADESRLNIGLHEDSPLLNKEEGELIFDQDGNKTEWMSKISEFLSSAYNEELKTKSLLNELDSLGLLVPQTLTYTLSKGGEEKNIDGFYVVDKTKWAELSDSDLLKFREAQVLEPIYAHLASLENIQKLIKVKSAQ